MDINLDAPVRPHSVDNGVINALSVSQLKTAHLCLLQWYFAKVLRLPGKTFKALDVGTAMHARLEAYLLTGVDALGDIERPGKKYLPLPGPDPRLLIEHRFDGQPKGAPFNPKTALLRAASVPLDGYIDFVNTRMLESGGRAYPDAAEIDAPGTLELGDHKSSKDVPRYGSTVDQLGDPDADHGIQMIGYGEWGRLRFGSLVKRVRLTHVTYSTSVRDARRVSVVLDVDQIQIRWLTVNRIASSMVEAAKLTDPKQVPYNKRSCEAFGGCPYRAICPSTSLSVVPANSMFAKESTMSNSLLDDLGLGPAPVAPTAPAIPAPVASSPVQASPVQASPPADYAAFLAWQKAEAAKAAPVQAAPPKIAITEVQDDPKCTDCGAVLNAQNGSKSASGWKHIGCPAKAALQAPVAPQAPAAELPIIPEPRIATVTQTTTVTETTVEEAPKKKGPGRPPKAKAEETPTSTVSMPVGDRVELFIRCMPGGNSKRLEDYVAEKVKLIETKYNVPDVRLSTDKESPIAFGKWKGVLAYVIKAEPPTAGRYTVSSEGEVMQAALEALIPLVKAEDVVVGR